MPCGGPIALALPRQPHQQPGKQARPTSSGNHFCALLLAESDCGALCSSPFSRARWKQPRRWTTRGLGVLDVKQAKRPVFEASCLYRHRFSCLCERLFPARADKTRSVPSFAALEKFQPPVCDTFPAASRSLRHPQSSCQRGGEGEGGVEEPKGGAQ